MRAVLRLLWPLLFIYQFVRYTYAAMRGRCADCGHDLIETEQRFVCPDCDIRGKSMTQAAAQWDERN